MANSFCPSTCDTLSMAQDGIYHYIQMPNFESYLSETDS